MLRFIVADPRGAQSTPPGSEFFQYHAVLGKFLQNWRPHFGEILDPSSLDLSMKSK